MPQATVLVELAAKDTKAVKALLTQVKDLLANSKVTLVETSFASSLGRLYVVLEAANKGIIDALLKDTKLPVLDAALVRVVGTPAESDAVQPSHLVEWDLPQNLKMDQYLQRKAEKTPLYANAPTVKFLRTYVREDMAKCVCLYQAPDEAAVRHAREVVSAPVDRLAQLDDHGS